MKKWIPNLITLLNLFMGCIGALYAFKNDLLMAGIFVGLGIFFDFFDGLAARLLKVSSELGTQLDSLADMVTSGLVPGIAMYQLLKNSIGVGFFDYHRDFIPASDYWLAHPFLPLAGFIITLGSCYRLAKFNIDTRQTDSFIGLPTPANALLIIFTGVIIQYENVEDLIYILNNPYFLLILTLLSCYLLNAELPLFALKFKNFSFKENKLRFGFLLLCVILLAALRLVAIPVIIISYVALSVINNIVTKRAA